MGEKPGNRISVIVPAYNAARTLGACIEACLDQTHAALELIVVDDGSTDETVAIANRFPVRLLRQPNRGPAAARNFGASMARGDVIAFTDADCIPEPEWLERLMSGFAEGVVAVGGSYAIANDSRFLARMVHEEILIRHSHLTEDVDFLGSFNVAYRKSAFDATGGFDETFRHASGEDNDLAYRLRDRGGRFRFIASARVAHHHPERLWPYLRTQMRHGFWRMKLYAKHPRRSTGDQYASWPELVAPPIAIGCLGLVPALLVYGHVSYAAHGGFPASTFLASVFILTGLLTLHLPLQRAFAERVGVADALRYDAVLLLRDVARGFGLLRGIWTFFVLRKETI